MKKNTFYVDSDGYRIIVTDIITIGKNKYVNYKYDKEKKGPSYRKHINDFLRAYTEV